MRKRIMAGFLSLLMIFGFMVKPSNGEAITGISERNAKTENLEALEATGQIEALEEMKTSINRGVKYKPEDEVTIIVELEGDTLVDSASEAVGDFAVSTRGQALIDKIIEQHQRVKKEIDKKVDRVSFEDGHNYTAVMNGFTLKVPYKDLKTIQSLRGVKCAYVAGSYDIPVADSASETSSTRGGVSLNSDMINDTGYTGKGVAVAILDSGLDYDHEAFSVEPEEVKYSQEEMKAFIEKSTDALSSGGEGEVISSKIIFSYDYADDDSNVMPNSGNEHGTHVAGTVAGNNGSDFLGVAPDAQLMIMKVFSNSNKGASEEDVLAALEDAVILGADVINMSLGASAGFTESAVEATKEMYQRIEKAGINLMVAAGNSYWQGYKITENNYPYGATPDYGIVSSPSTYGSSVSVASIESGEGGRMSGFSSWGTTPGLTLKPEITAPGEDIYSSVPGGGYKIYSGTSMAAPYMSGAAAILKEYVNESFQEADSTEKMEVINNILMSTATPVVEYDYDNGTVDYYSPRKQGAGLVNIYNAINSGAYLYVGDNQRPKAELGDSTTGEYEFTFTIKNYSHEARSYSPELQLQTDSPNPKDSSYNYLTSYTFLDGTGDEDEAYITISWDNTLEESHDDFKYIKDTATGTATITGYKGTDTVVIIPATIDGYTVTTIGEAAFQGKEAITEVILPDTITTIEKYAFLNTGIKEIVVGKNVTTIEDYSIGYTTASEVGRKIIVLPLEEVEVTVEIELSDEVIDSFLEYFSNGFYVEGFMVLKSENDDEVDLSMPLLGFLGDWDSLELFDGTIYDGDSYYYSSQMMGMYYNSSEDSWFYYATLGENHITGEYDGENLSYSPYLASNKYGEEGYTYISTDTGLLRNARDISYTISDSQGKEIANYGYLFGADATKSYYYTGGAYVTSLFDYEYYNYLSSGEGFDSTNLEDGDYTLTISAMAGEGDVVNTLSYDFYVDTVSPELKDYQVINTTDNTTALVTSASDNRPLQGVNIATVIQDADGELFLGPDITEVMNYAATLVNKGYIDENIYSAMEAVRPEVIGAQDQEGDNSYFIWDITKFDEFVTLFNDHIIEHIYGSEYTMLSEYSYIQALDYGWNSSEGIVIDMVVPEEGGDGNEGMDGQEIYDHILKENNSKEMDISLRNSEEGQNKPLSEKAVPIVKEKIVDGHEASDALMKVDGFNIYGYLTTEADAYAEANEINFIPLDKGTIVVSVKDSEGACIKGATILMEDITLETDENGQAVFENISAGSYSIELVSVPEGYVLPTSTDAQLQITIDGERAYKDYTVIKATSEGSQEKPESTDQSGGIEEPAGNAVTGDSFHIGLWIIIMFFSLGIGIILIRSFFKSKG